MLPQHPSSGSSSGHPTAFPRHLRPAPHSLASAPCAPSTSTARARLEPGRIYRFSKDPGCPLPKSNSGRLQSQSNRSSKRLKRSVRGLKLRSGRCRGSHAGQPGSAPAGSGALGSERVALCKSPPALRTAQADLEQRNRETTQRIEKLQFGLLASLWQHHISACLPET